MSPDYQFVHKLWLSKHLPWINDIAYYFTHMVCQQFVVIIKKPDESKNSITLMNIMYYGVAIIAIFMSILRMIMR